MPKPGKRVSVNPSSSDGAAADTEDEDGVGGSADIQMDGGGGSADIQMDGGGGSEAFQMGARPEGEVLVQPTRVFAATGLSFADVVKKRKEFVDEDDSGWEKRAHPLQRSHKEELGLNEKRRVLRGTSRGQQPLGYTYGGVGTSLKNDFPWMESLQLPANSDELENFTFKIWQEGNPKFSSVAKEYKEAMKELAFRLLQLLTARLGLEADDISKHLEEGDNSVFRFNYYPPCPQPSLTLGLGAHSDPHLLTILHQDEVGGLQILRNNKWRGIRPNPNSLLVNVGDVLQVWSNDAYESMVHRVVCNTLKPRLSMAFFLNPAEETRVAPPPQLINKEEGPHYRPFTWAEYRESMYAVRLRGKSNLFRFKCPPPT